MDMKEITKELMYDCCTYCMNNIMDTESCNACKRNSNMIPYKSKIMSTYNITEPCVNTISEYMINKCNTCKFSSLEGTDKDRCCECNLHTGSCTNYEINEFDWEMITAKLEQMNI